MDSNKSSKSTKSTQLFIKYGKACRRDGSSKSSSDSEKADEIDDSKVKQISEDADQENKEKNRKITPVAEFGTRIKEPDPMKEQDDDENRKITPYAEFGINDSKADSIEEEDDDYAIYKKGEAEVDGDDEAATRDDDFKEISTESEAEVDGDNETATGNDEIATDENETATGDDDFEETGKEGRDESLENVNIAEENIEKDETIEGKKRKKVKPVMEYDLKHMYPEINILIQKKKREWDFQDPDIIRALWLETKTLALADWKVRNAKIKIKKPSFEIKDNTTLHLRQKFLKDKDELQQALEERNFRMTAMSRNPPHFDAIQLATNVTTDMRYKYTRNNPPVPSHYIEHFEKFKKPPFKNNPINFSCKNC